MNILEDLKVEFVFNENAKNFNDLIIDILNSNVEFRVVDFEDET